MVWNFKNFEKNIAAVSDTNETITYAALFEQTKIFKALIQDRCLVFSLCTNTIGSLVGYTSFIENNIVPLLIGSDMDEILLNNLIDTYKPDYYWVPESSVEKFRSSTEIYRSYDYVLLKTENHHAYPLFDKLGLLLTTSGSTGSPKLVRLSYGNIIANMKSIVQYLELDENERPITTLPMSYTYGLSIINSHLCVGATILLTTKTLMEKGFWEFFKEQKATSFGGVPYTYEILNKLRFFRMDLPSLKTMTQAGGKLSPELHYKLAEHAQVTDRRFFVMYGQTEATARMAYLPYEKSLEKYGSMGIAIPGGEFFLIDADNNEIIQSDLTGELVYKGENVSLGYAECGNDLNKNDENQGVLLTGDMAIRDEDGYYFIVGRKKRFLKIFGNRVNLDESERMIQSAFENSDCACAGIDDHMYIFITNDDHKEPVKQFISEKTGLNHSAFKIIIIDSIPKNESGKTLYINLEKYYD